MTYPYLKILENNSIYTVEYIVFLGRVHLTIQSPDITIYICTDSLCAKLTILSITCF